MNEVSVQQTKWIEANLVPKIAKCIGKKSGDLRCDVTLPENCFFLSCVCFVDMKSGQSLRNDEGAKSEDTLRLVVKRPPLNVKIANRMNIMKQFHNEILFYTKFATGCSRFPRCVYANEATLDDTVVVTENISVQGYELCPQAYDLPLDYVLSAVNEIGRLHAMAYAMKERQPDKFSDIVSDIQEPRFRDNEWMKVFIETVATRPIDWLRRHNYGAEFCDKIEKHLGNCFKEILLECTDPVEPIATLCHGDFTRNNVFFRKIDGILEAKLFDFALISYSSPAIDISTFLYLNCSAKDRIEKFDEIYRSYYRALTNHLHDSGIYDVDKYSYDTMLADYKKRAAFGYVIAVFFLPIVRGMAPADLDPEELFADPTVAALKNKQFGGEEMTELFGKMILELRDFGAFDHVL